LGCRCGFRRPLWQSLRFGTTLHSLETENFNVVVRN
jgi:hypothetical protein